MIRNTVLAAGVGAAVLLGVAGTAYASESVSTPSPTAPTSAAATAAPTSTPAAHPHRHGAFRGEYGEWTTYDAATRTSTVHQGIRGTVSAVSPTNITVTAVDGTPRTFTVDPTTKIHEKGQQGATAGAINEVKVGDHAGVIGTGSGTGTATHILDRGAAPSAAQ